MCKSIIRRVFYPAGGVTKITTRHYGDLCAALSNEPNWRGKFGEALRCLAQKIDKRITYSIAGVMPNGTTEDEWADAVAHGHAYTARYLNDLAREREVGPQAFEVAGD